MRPTRIESRALWPGGCTLSNLLVKQVEKALLMVSPSAQRKPYRPRRQPASRPPHEKVKELLWRNRCTALLEKRLAPSNELSSLAVLSDDPYRRTACDLL